MLYIILISLSVLFAATLGKNVSYSPTHLDLTLPSFLPFLFSFNDVQVSLNLILAAVSELLHYLVATVLIAYLYLIDYY